MSKGVRGDCRLHGIRSRKREKDEPHPEGVNGLSDDRGHSLRWVRTVLIDGRVK